MNSWQDSFRAAMKLLPVAVFMGMSPMLRPILAPEIEERLGRKLTDLEWQYFLQESNRKSEVDSRQRVISQWRQRLADRQVIHDFVWREDGK